MIAAVIGALIIGEELWLPLLEELGMLAFEWAHKALDLLFEEIFGLADEASQRASAWTGLLLIIVLVVWGILALRKKYRQAKAAAPRWWAERQAETKQWWGEMPWLLKLLHISGGLLILVIIVMLI